MIALVCLDFPKFIAVKMRITLKPYFLGGCGEDLRRRYLPYFKQRFALAGKKAALRLDMVRIHLGYCRNDNRNDFLHFNYLFLFFEKHIAFG